LTVTVTVTVVPGNTAVIPRPVIGSLIRGAANVGAAAATAAKPIGPTVPIPPIAIPKGESTDGINRHTSNRRKSNEPTHEKGKKRIKTDRGGEKGDKNRGDKQTPEQKQQNDTNKWKNAADEWVRKLPTKQQRSVKKFRHQSLKRLYDHLKRLGFDGGPPPGLGKNAVWTIANTRVVGCQKPGYKAYEVQKGGPYCWCSWTKRSKKNKAIPWTEAKEECRRTCKSGDPGDIKPGETICVPE